MKKLIYLFMLSPFMALAQDSPSLIFEIATIKVSPMNTTRVESGMAAHNKKYHGAGASGVRVYVVSSGKNSGQYKWVMGPAPWSALDSRPSDDGHEMDWQANVNQFTMAEGDAEYIRMDTKLSRFPKDFNISKLLVRYIDINRGSYDKVKAILEKITKVYADKIPNEIYGVYFNELPSSSSGRDLTIVSFFDKYAWMGQEDNFNAKYDEIYGKGASTIMWDEWRSVTGAQEMEIWEFREDLSGISAMVKAAERQ